MIGFHFSCCLHSKKKSRNLHHTHVCNESRGQHWHLMWFQNCRSRPPRSMLLGRQYFFPAWNKNRYKPGTSGCCKGETVCNMVHYLGLIKIHTPRVLVNIMVGLFPMLTRKKKHHKSLLNWSSDKISDPFVQTVVVQMVQIKASWAFNFVPSKSWSFAPQHCHPALQILSSHQITYTTVEVSTGGAVKIRFQWETIGTFHSKQYANKNWPFCTNFLEGFTTGLNSFQLFISENISPIYKK